MEKTAVAIVDDHRLFREGIAELIGHFDGYQIVNQSGNGKELIESLQQGPVPDLAVIDIQMPVMNGEETAKWIKQSHPHIKILALTMHDDDANILRMIKAGARGYVLKSAEPEELKLAMDQITLHNFYHSELITNSLMKNFMLDGQDAISAQLNLEPKEREFLELICSELTYKEIADRMQVTIRIIDSYREILFSKCNCKSRVGLALFAVKHELVKL